MQFKIANTAFIILTYFIVTVSCSSDKTEQNSPVSEQSIESNSDIINNKKPEEEKKNIQGASDWYLNGNLHKSNIGEWLQANYKNKLATCADFVASTVKVSSMEELKNYSIEVVECIDKSIDIKEKSLYTQLAAERASLCIVIMKLPLK